MSMEALRHLLSSLLGLAVIIVISLAVVWPVWYVATTWTTWYTAIAVLSVVIASAYGIAIKLGRRIPVRSRIPAYVSAKGESGAAGSTAGVAKGGDASGES